MLNPYNTQFSDRDLMETAVYLKSKGLSDAQAGEILGMMQRGEVEMSQQDGVTITKSEADVPGSYISAEQKLQDNYAGGIAAQQAQQTSGMQADPLYFLKVPDHNIGVQMSSNNPNYKVVTEGQRQTVDANGNVVIY